MNTIIKTSVRRLLAFLLIVAALPPSAFGAAKILNLPYREERLPNGLRIFMVKYPSSGTVSFQIPVHAGSRNEVEKGKTGFAHFFEHLMFRGTKNMSGKDFGELYAKLGAENNVWMWLDMTNYHGVVASVYLPKILEAEADRFANLFFDEKALRDEAGAVMGEYNKSVARPEFLLDEKLVATAFKVHPYGHTTMGYKEDVWKFTERYKDVWPFFQQYYRPSNISIVLVGDVDFDQNLAFIREKFGGWKDPEMKPVTIPQEPKQTAPRSAEVRLNKPTQTRVVVAYKVPAFSTKNTDSAALELIAEMAFSVTSEFQKTYRFEKKWLDSVDAGALQTVDPGLWQVSLRLSQAGEAHQKEIVKAVESTIVQLRSAPPSLERLIATKTRFQNAAVTSWFSSPEQLAGRIAWYTNFEPDLDVINRIFERLEEVTPEVILDYAKRHLIDSGKTTVQLKGSKA